MVESSAGTSLGPRAFKILVVDDNRDAADTLAILARLWGYEARAVYDAVAGLETACTFQPDCVVLDIGMPGTDGYELARRLRQQPSLRRTKLVALTAYSSDQHNERARQAGFDYYLVKPAPPPVVEELFKMLEQALKLAERTEALAKENLKLSTQTKALLTEMREDIQEAQEEIHEVKQELLEVKQEIREVKEEVRDFRENSTEGPQG